MALIDNSYFRGHLHIANAANIVVSEKLDYYINKYETEMLDRILGLDFRILFKAGIVENPMDQKWADLLNGKIFVDANGYKKEWVGFQNEAKISPIANYVYYKYIVDNVNHTVGAGNLRPELENGQVVSPAPKLVRVWAEMSQMLSGLTCFLKSDPGLYPEWLSKKSDCSLLKSVNSFNL